MRGSYVGSVSWVAGKKSGTFCPVRLLISKVDIGFFRNGRPFLARCASGGLAAVEERGGGSPASLVPAGRRPVALEF